VHTVTCTVSEVMRTFWMPSCGCWVLDHRLTVDVDVDVDVLLLPFFQEPLCRQGIEALR
jgi:hypothetical protein